MVRTLAAALAATIALGAAAAAQPARKTISITLRHEDSPGNPTLQISVVDQNQGRQVFDGQWPRGFGNPIPIATDSSGKGKIKWTAKTLDPPLKSCEGSGANLSDKAVVPIRCPQ